jgi:hypothetical protein
MATVSIYRAAASELFIKFPTRIKAYLWAKSFAKRWSADYTLSPFQEEDSCSWGTHIFDDSYFEVLMYTGHHNPRMVEGESYSVDPGLAMELGQDGEPPST